MKRRMILMLCCSLVLTLFLGCSDDANVAPIPNDSTIAPTTATAETKTPDSLVQQELRIFIVEEREDFERFLSAPSSQLLTLQNTYSQPNAVHETVNVTMFPISQEFMNFVNNKNGELQQFLAQNGVSCTVEETTLFEVPSMPMVIWVKTDKGHYYITVDEQPVADRYSYLLYTNEEFVRKFSCKDATVCLEDAPIETECVAKLYHDYADIPFLAVLKTLGADVTWNGETSAHIQFLDRHYELTLDSPITLCKQGSDDSLLDEIVGGCFFVYAQGQELMLDSATFLYAMESLKCPVNVSYDRDEAAVMIEPIATTLPTVTTTAESFDFDEFAEYINAYDGDINIGDVLNEEDAVDCALALWNFEYGTINGEPYDPTCGREVLVRYNQEHNCWWVFGTLPPKTKGSVPSVLIQTDGTVLAVFLY